MNHKTHEGLVYEISSEPKKRVNLFREIPANKKGVIFLKLPKRVQHIIFKKLSDKEIVKFISYLDPDEVSDVVPLLKGHRRDRIIKKLSKDRRDKVEFLLRFSPKSAAGIMSLDYIIINKNSTFENVSRLVKKHEKRTGKFPTLLVAEEGMLIGELQPYKLVVAGKKEKITKYITKVPHIEYNKSEEEIVNIFRKNLHSKIVVLDKDFSIMGIIYSDDLLAILEKKSSKSIASFAGLKEDEDVFDPAIIKVKNRYSWLLMNVMVAFLAAGVVAIFEDKIAAVTLLAVYMPIVAAVGGNAGTQSLAVVVRGLAMKKIELRTSAKVIRREILAGLMNGLIVGVFVAGIAMLWNKNPLFGLVIGVSMVINLVFSGLFGAVSPLVMKKFGKDPAASATIFITTATDIFGFGSFLGLAALIL